MIAALPRPRWWVLAGLAVASLVILGYPVNGNIRYEVGVHRASVFSVVDTFSHRPLVFRLLVEAMAWLPTWASGLLAAPNSLLGYRLFEAGFRAGCLLAAGAAAVMLGLGLARRGVPHAWGYAVAGYAALAFTSPATGEPDWWAPLFALAAVGAGLLGRRWTGGTAAGVLLAASALVKISSLPVAVAGLLVLVALDRGRAVVAALAAFGAGVCAIATMVLATPHEVRWLLDIRALQPDAWTPAAWAEAQGYLGNVAARWPVVALVPAFFVGALRRESLVAAGALVLTCFGIAFQGQYYLYHAATLVVVSSLLAVRTITRSGLALAAPLLVASTWTLWLFTTPAEWRIRHAEHLIAVTAMWAAGLVIVQLLALRGGRRARPRGWVAAGLVAASLLATQTPTSAEYLSTGATHITAMTNLERLGDEVATAARVHALIGADTPVTYLTFGAATYTLGNPTHCRYPSPLFLQRGGAEDKVSAQTFEENLACVSDPASRWLIWNRDWLHRKGANPRLLATIEQHWNCETPKAESPYLLCARRTTAD